MSRGGRGGGGSMVNIASALGFQRGDMPQSQVVSVPPALFPPLDAVPLPRSAEARVAELGALHEDVVGAFADSAFHIPPPSHANSSLRIRRYTDKYKLQARPPFHPKWGVIPDELLFGKWVKKREKKSASGEPKAKRAKKDLESSLSQLEKKEKEVDADDTASNEVGEGGGEESGSEGEGKRKKAEEEGPTAEMSDEDYAEEDNDYATNYFDNGEGPEDSGDNADDDNVY